MKGKQGTATLSSLITHYSKTLVSARQLRQHVERRREVWHDKSTEYKSSAKGVAEEARIISIEEFISKIEQAEASMLKSITVDKVFKLSDE